MCWTFKYLQTWELAFYMYIGSLAHLSKCVKIVTYRQISKWLLNIFAIWEVYETKGMATTLCSPTNSYIITWKVNGLCKSVKYEQKCTFSTHKKWHAVCSDNKNCLILMPLNEHFELNFTKFKLHSELKLNLWWTFENFAELGACFLHVYRPTSTLVKMH